VEPVASPRTTLVCFCFFLINAQISAAAFFWTQPLKIQDDRVGFVKTFSQKLVLPWSITFNHGVARFFCSIFGFNQ